MRPMVLIDGQGDDSFVKARTRLNPLALPGQAAPLRSWLRGCTECGFAEAAVPVRFKPAGVIETAGKLSRYSNVAASLAVAGKLYSAHLAGRLAWVREVE